MRCGEMWEHKRSSKQYKYAQDSVRGCYMSNKTEEAKEMGRFRTAEEEALGAGKDLILVLETFQ